MQQFATVEKELSELKQLQREIGAGSIIEYGSRITFLTDLRAELYTAYTNPHGANKYA